MKNADKPAMPTLTGSECWSNQFGLTKREMFAMAAMQGINSCDVGENMTCVEIAEYSVRQADVLLKALEKDNER